MATDNPNHPQPDEIPEDKRTGDEPNPSGKYSTPKENYQASIKGPSRRHANAMACYERFPTQGLNLGRWLRSQRIAPYRTREKSASYFLKRPGCGPRRP